MRNIYKHIHPSADLNLKKLANVYGNICSMVLVNHIAAEVKKKSFVLFFIKVYSQRYLHNYKIQLPGQEISKSDTSQGQALSKGGYPTPNAIWSLPQSHQLGLNNTNELPKQSPESHQRAQCRSSLWMFHVGSSTESLEPSGKRSDRN